MWPCVWTSDQRAVPPSIARDANTNSQSFQLVCRIFQNQQGLGQSRGDPLQPEWESFCDTGMTMKVRRA